MKKYDFVLSSLEGEFLLDGHIYGYNKKDAEIRLEDILQSSKHKLYRTAKFYLID
jgi:hypothetical protein